MSYTKRRPVGEIGQTEEAASIRKNWKPVIAGLIYILFLSSGCGSGNLDYLKANADKRWEELGFTVVGYQGYEWGIWGIFGSRYGGAKVWYELKKNPDNGITYYGFLWRWGDEIRAYNIRARDAIRPHN